MKTLTKMLLSIILSLTMLIALVPATAAMEVENVPASETVSVVLETAAATISEYTTDDGSVVRVLRRTSSDLAPISQDSDETYDFCQVKEELAALGWESDDLDDLSDEQLQMYANSLQISIVQRYIKRDQDGNITVIPKEQALAEVAAIKAQGVEITENYPYRDEYLFVGMEISTISGAKVHVRADATWMTDPQWRGTDSLSACAEFVTIENYTRKGLLQYDHHILNQADYISSTKREEKSFDHTQFTNVSDGNFYGTALSFDLLKNVYGSAAETQYGDNYSNFHIQIEYDGMIKFEDQTLNFNATSTYAHTYVGVTFNPEFTIQYNQSGMDAVASIMPTVTWNKEIHTAQLEIHYTP